MEWAGHVANAGEKKNHYNILVANLKGIAKLEDIGLGGMIILK
jgi:hypothetical protein